MLPPAVGRTEPEGSGADGPAAESGKGRGRGSEEEVTRNSCSIPPVQMEVLNTSTPFISSLMKSMFISSMAPLSIFNINQDRVKGNRGSFSRSQGCYSCLGQGCRAS